MENGFKLSVVEAMILSSPEPLSGRKIAEMLDELTSKKVGQIVAELNNRYMQSGSSYRIREISGGYQFYIMPEFTGYVQELFARRRKIRMTRAALETLAIVAYKQPVTKSEIEQIRGVASDGVIHNLLEKNMITIKGRAKTVGKPLQYGTAAEFLKFFGLNQIEDLPRMSEIEELIASEESQTQTELHLKHDKEIADENIKLNIANGTYNPDKKIEIDEDTGMPVVTDLKDDSNNKSVNKTQKNNSTHSENNKEEQTEKMIDIDTTFK